MESVQATFEVVKVDEKTWDVIILADNEILKSFVKVYPNLFYVDESVFDKQPVVIAPDFPNQLHAMTWKQYWVDAFLDPDNACKTCPTVNQLLEYIEEARTKTS